MMDSLPVNWVTTGWAAVGKGWPLILFGVLVGYPFGENARKKFAIDTASREAIQLGEKYAKEAAAREINADRILKEAQALHSDYPQLKNKLREAQRDIESLKMGEDYYRENYNDEHRGKQSAEKELEKARAKIRRLVERDKRRTGKRVDDSPFQV
jgi:predicted RNase H-like nuclease (RuvC/YqgF family)